MVSTINIVRFLSIAAFALTVYTGNMVLWLALFVVSVAGALAAGRVYCGYICPMNTLMVPAEHVSKRLNLQTNETPAWLKSDVLPWLFLACSIAATVLARVFLKRNIPVLPLWLIVAVAITLRFRPAVFHNYICPFGALQRLAGQHTVFTRRVDKARCVGCGLCEKVCPSDAISVGSDKKAKIAPSLCHQCTNCTSVCPASAVTYGRRG